MLIVALALPAAARSDVAPPSVEEVFRIATLGDSYASGEGAPDVFGNYDNDGHGDQKEDWDSSLGEGTSADIDAERCHRSRNAPSAIAARYLDTDFPDLSVPFTSVACSGAAIVEQGVFKTDPIPEPGGLLRSYNGADNLYNFDPRPSTPALSPQISQLNSKLNDKIDALVIGIGGNDAGFGAFIVECSEIFLLSHSGSDCTTNDELRDFRDGRLDRLRGTSSTTSRYDRLAGSIEGNNLLSSDPELEQPPGEVFVVAIPDVLYTSSSGFCNGTPSGHIEEKISAKESEYLEEGFKGPLNTIMRNKASAHGWTFVSDHVNDFRGHAICQSDRWFNRNKDALPIQGDDVAGARDTPGFDFSQGWVHPNVRGYQQTGGALYRELVDRAVFQYTPAVTPAVLALSATATSINFRAFDNALPDLASGYYHAFRLLQVQDDGTITNVGSGTPTLLEYGDRSFGVIGQGRFIALTRACAPLARDRSIGCGPTVQTRASTFVPRTATGVQAAGTTDGLGQYALKVTWKHADSLAAHDTTRSTVTVKRVGSTAAPVTHTVSGRDTFALVDTGGQSKTGFDVTVQACNAPRGCAPATAPVRVSGVVKSTSLAPTTPQIAPPFVPCDNRSLPFGGPTSRTLPGRTGRAAITISDRHPNYIAICPDNPDVGILSASPRKASVRAGRPLSMRLGWRHPRQWREIHTVTARLRSKRGVVATLLLDQNTERLTLGRGARTRGSSLKFGKGGKLRARGVQVLLKRNAFRDTGPTGRDVFLNLRLRLPKRLAGQALVLEMAGTGDDQARQPFRQAAVLRVRR